MDQTEFREFGHAMVDYIINYRENIRDRDVYPSVEPGYLYSRIPTEMPQTPDSWQNVLNDVETHIMPGITHWQSPRFHAYFPTASSYPSILGEMLAASLGVIGFSWITSPACTELEVVMMNWLGKLIGLPSQFLNCSEGPGGGIIQGSASEATLIGLLAAKEKTVHRLKRENPQIDENIIRTKLVSYTSDQSNSSVEKAGLLASVPMRLLPADGQGKLTAAILNQAIQQDIHNGLIPCYVVATLGTTGTCAFDDLQEIGPICEQHNIWLHVDAAYAGAAFICPEYQQLMAGVEYADSFDINCHKWMLVNFDCSAMWLKNTNDLNNAFNVDRLYLESNVTSHIPDFRHWQIPLGRRFRALKLWFTLRLYGVVGLQAHIRKHINLAKLFEQVVTQDDRFEIVVPAVMGLVGFRLKGDNSLSRLLLDRILLSRQLYMVPAIVNDQFTIRFVVCSEMTTEQDIHHDWVAIQNIATNILSNYNTIENDAKNIENGSIGENIDVKSIENGSIGENINVKSIKNGSIGENIDVKSIENGSIGEDIDVKSIENGSIGENIDVKSIENGSIGENIDVKNIENGSIGENINAKNIENGSIGENIDVKNIENGSIGENIDAKNIENGSIGENIDVKNIENGSIGENIDVKSIENGSISENIENGPFSEIIEKKEKCFANTVVTLVKKEKAPKNVCIGK